jgi:hypothetical protein
LREYNPIQKIERLSPINIQTCNGCIPDNWSISAHKYGISDGQGLFGSTQWTKPLGNPPTGSGSFITVGINGINQNGANVSTAYKNLIAGKKYKLTFSVSTASIKSRSGENSPYASKILVYGGGPHQDHAVINLAAKPDQWITESMTFTATDDLITGHDKLWFIVLQSEPKINKTAYVNIHVNPNSLELVD